MSSPPLLDDALVSAGLAAIATAPSAELQHFTLDNGLTVYLREDHHTPLAAVQLWYHVGASDEPEGQTNLSHLLEHLIFDGSSKLAKGQYLQVIARLGGKANGTTTDDATAFDIQLPAIRLPIALEIMADAMTTATFGQPEMDLAIKTVEDERRLKIDNAPLQQASHQHLKLAHAGSPYGNPTFGLASDLNNLTLDTLRSWYDQWYAPGNATLVVVGAVDLTTLKQHVARYFADLPVAATTPRPVPRHEIPLKARSQAVSLPMGREGLFMSFNVPSLATAPQATTGPALKLLGELLGKGFSSRLYSRLVRDRNVLKGVVLSYDPLLRGDTLLTISAYVNTDNCTPNDAAEEIYRLVDELRHTPLTQEELDRTKLRLLARYLFNQESITWQARLIGQAAASGLGPSLIDQQANIVRHLDSATVRQVAFDYLSRERLTVTYLQLGDPA
ncbi:M16 family metallopeptidase [Pseudomonas carassii]|uniref:Pitrilysin family protein n=1 Tax=Pseudomonas carassii TaxID=3115855 RepID=A0ABU7H8T4_9PSED|nr:pitrilysin family protein [Pseudomonas sp. 137P]MEE1887715.1 pitrilysin family protein [Pseudomonas sp. 137P]